MTLVLLSLLAMPLVAAQTDTGLGGLGDIFKGLPIIGGMGMNGILLVVGVVLLILGFAKAGKSQGTGKTFLWIGASLLLLTVLFPTLLGGPDAVSPLGDIFKGFGGGIGTQQPASVVINNPQPSIPTLSTICAVEDTTVTLSAINKYTQVAVGGQHAYRVGSAPISRVADAGTFTSSPGDLLTILWGNATTSAAYLSDVSTETVPCLGTVSLSREMLQNGTATIEVFNEEGNLVDSTIGTVPATSENETLGAGDVVTLRANIKGQYQRGFPYGGVLVVEMNGTGSGSTIDDMIADFGGKETSVPSIYSINKGTQSRTKAYTIPAILSNQVLSGTIVIDADDTNNPAAGTSAAAGDDPVLTFYAYNYYVDEDKQSSFTGPAAEDEDDVIAYGHVTQVMIAID